jgi:hypothetical protein
MKKGIFWALTIIFLFTFTSLAFSEEQAMTPEKISGIWEGGYHYINDGGYIELNPGRVIFTPNLNGIMRVYSQMGQFDFVFDGHGDIVNNQMIIRDREKTSMVRIKASITRKNRLEGEVRFPLNQGDISGFKKIRDLTDEEKQLPLTQLKGLLK